MTWISSMAVGAVVGAIAGAMRELRDRRGKFRRHFDSDVDESVHEGCTKLSG